ANNPTMVMMSIHKTHKAFTIVELLIVIVVIGILASNGIVSYNGIQDRATSTSLKVDLQNVAKGLEIDKLSAGLSYFEPEVLENYLTTEGSHSVINCAYGGLNYFCIEGIKKNQTTASYHIDSRNGLTNTQEGACPEASGETYVRCKIGRAHV